ALRPAAVRQLRDPTIDRQRRVRHASPFTVMESGLLAIAGSPSQSTLKRTGPGFVPGFTASFSSFSTDAPAASSLSTGKFLKHAQSSRKPIPRTSNRHESGQLQLISE